MFRKPLAKPADCTAVFSDYAMLSVADHMECNFKQTWTVSELYKQYQESGGQLSSKIMMLNLTRYFGDKLVILHSEGCANIIGYRNFLSRSLKLVAQKDASEDDEMDWLVRLVRSEVKAIPKANVKDIGFVSVCI